MLERAGTGSPALLVFGTVPAPFSRGRLKLSRVCTICRNGKCDAINALLISGTASIRRIAADNGVTESALRRHAAKHIPQALARAQEAAEVANADTLLDQVKSLQARALTILDAAEKADDLRTALQAVREARGLLELLAKLTGELAAQPSMQQNVMVGVGLTPEEQGRRTEAGIVQRGGPSSAATAALLQKLDRLAAGVKAERDEVCGGCPKYQRE